VNIYIIGDSHTIALSRALVELKASGVIDSSLKVEAKFLYAGYRVGSEFYQRDGDVIKFKGQRIKNKLKAITGRRHISKKLDDPVFAISSGFYHRGLMEAMLCEKILPWNIRPEVEAVRRVSEHEIRALVYGFNKYLFRFFKDLQSLNIRFFLIAPPGPRADDRIGKIAPVLNGHLALDPLFRRIVQEWYENNDIEYLQAPRHTLNADLSLRSEFYEKAEGDDHHADIEYGKEMVMAVIEKAKSLYGRGMALR